MKVQIFADFTCPFSYMGIVQLEQAIQARKQKDVRFEFKSFQLKPDASKTSFTPAYDVLKEILNGDIHVVEERTKIIAEQAAQLGLTYNYEKMKYANTFNAHRLMKWSHEHGKQRELAAAFFKAVFTDGANLNKEDTLLQIVKDVGLDVDVAKAVLDSESYTTQVLDDKEEALQSAIHGVPVIRINGQNVDRNQVHLML